MLVVAGLVAGCSGEPSSGPVEVRWDRDQCERCRMVLSDRKHAAQVRQPMVDGYSRVYRFDDFGCAVIWLDGKDWRDDPQVEFWVADHRTGQWIDATTASYVAGHLSPMGYGLGAQRESAAGGLTFEQARRQVQKSEHRSARHSGRAEEGTAGPAAGDGR